MSNIVLPLTGISSSSHLNSLRVFKVPLKVIQLEDVKFVQNKQSDIEFNPIHTENIRYR
jgi:hypothetical protein